jgi:AcrR family transcriptional regulator
MNNTANGAAKPNEPREPRKAKAFAIAKPNRRTQQERSADARARLLDAAISLICQLGYSRTTMTEIASRAGMTRGAIQHHFSGREMLVLAILGTLEKQIIDAFEQVAPDRDITVAAKIDTVVDALGAVAQSDAYLAVLDIWVSTRADRALARPVRASVVRATQQYRALWARIFKNELPNQAYEDALRIIVAMLRGMVISRMFEIAPRSIALTIAICKDAAKRRISASAGELPVKAALQPRRRANSAPSAA